MGRQTCKLESRPEIETILSLDKCSDVEPGASSINQAILDAMAKEDADICRFIAETAEIGDWHHPQEVIQLPTV